MLQKNRSTFVTLCDLVEKATVQAVTLLPKCANTKQEKTAQSTEMFEHQPGSRSKTETHSHCKTDSVPGADREIEPGT